MEHLTHAISEFFIPVLIFTGIMAGMLIKAVVQILTTSTRERTRREIAAYVAEGSIKPEDGERLISAGDRPGDGNC